VKARSKIPKKKRIRIKRKTIGVDGVATVRRKMTALAKQLAPRNETLGHLLGMRSLRAEMRDHEIAPPATTEANAIHPDAKMRSEACGVIG